MNRQQRREAKKKGEDKPEAFQPEPELSSQIVKV